LKPIAIILAFYLLLGSIFPRTDFSQLLRLADLAEHFSEHQAEAVANGQDVSWWNFLKIHFLHTDHDHQEGGDQHANLPFHSMDSSIAFNLLCFSPKPPEQVLASADSDLPFYRTTFPLSGYRPGIFHPPAMA
jgi:hypothetical protein